MSAFVRDGGVTGKNVKKLETRTISFCRVTVDVEDECGTPEVIRADDVEIGTISLKAIQLPRGDRGRSIARGL